MSEAQIRITVDIPQVDVLNRGMDDIGRNLHLRPDGAVVLDYERHGAIWTGEEVGHWGVLE